MHENAGNVKIKTKRRVKGSYRCLERETLQKKRSKTTKHWGGAKSESERERKLEKLLKKLLLKNSRSIFKKADSRCSIDRKTGLINRTRQRLTQIFKQDFDWSKNRLDQSKSGKNIFLDRKKKLDIWKHTSKHWI